VGSNAVVVRDVPAGGTAVGIPARIVEDRSEIDREVKAGQMGFSAYAVTRAEDDPLAQAIHGLLDHAVETDRRIEVLLKTMERAGVSLEDDAATADKFDPNYLSKIVD
jgi:serine O-acetyltransferase